MIALDILRDAQEQVFKATRERRTIRCYFVEANRTAFEELSAAVRPYNDPLSKFFVQIFHGKFESAVPDILEFVKGSFALTFIDPTGWTGYDFSKTGPLLRHAPGEVLLNYMFDHINRFTAWDDPSIVGTFDGILGEDWSKRLDKTIPRSDAVEALFRSEFYRAGQFKFVLLTPVEKPSERVHFCIAYGTRSTAGLQAYRDIEFQALSKHGARRMEAAAKADLAVTGQLDMLAGVVTTDNRSIETQVGEIKGHAEAWIINKLKDKPAGMPFAELWPLVLDQFMLRLTDVKDICAKLGSEGEIDTPWKLSGEKRRKPSNNDLIRLILP
jgi:three-Cys-motif partner protein